MFKKMKIRGKNNTRTNKYIFSVYDRKNDPDLISLRNFVKFMNKTYNFCLKVSLMPRGGKRNGNSATTLVKGAKYYDVYLYKGFDTYTNKHGKKYSTGGYIETRFYNNVVNQLNQIKNIVDTHPHIKNREY